MTDAPNIVLTGFMGTGKSTVGRLLAERLGYEFVDTDELIEAEHGPIVRVFAEHGEAWFRELERSVARHVATRRGCVISSGGGMLLDRESAAEFAASGTVVCLVADLDTIIERATSSGSRVRPLLAGGDARERVRELLAERAEVYARYPQIDTSGIAPDAVVDEILEVCRLAP